MRNFSEVLRSRRWVALAVLVVALFATPMLLRMLRPTYLSTAEVAVVGNGTTTNAILPSSDIPNVTMSTAVIERVKQRLQLSDSVGDIRSKLTARMSPRSNVMPISYGTKNVGDAVRIPNALADATVDEYKHIASIQYDQLIHDIHQQLATDEASIKDADRRLQTVVQSDTYAGQEHGLDSLSSRLAELEVQRGTANAALVADQATAKLAATPGKLEDVYKQQALATDPYYTAVRQAQAKDAADLIAVKSGYTNQYPGLPGLQDKVSRESTEVARSKAIAAAADLGASSAYAQDLAGQRSAQALVAGDQARLNSIDDQLTQVREHLRNLSGSGVDANSLRMERDSASAAYTILEGRLQQTVADRAQASALSGLVVLDYATNASPKIPPFMMAMLIAVVIVGAMVGAAYAAEALDPRLRKPVEVEDLYGSGHLGSIVR